MSKIKEPIIDATLQGQLHQSRTEFEEYLSGQVSSIERMYDNCKSKAEIEQVKGWEEMLIKLKGFFEIADDTNKKYANKLIEFETYYAHLKMNSDQYKQEIAQIYAESVELTEILFEITKKMEFKEKQKTLIESFHRIDVKQINALGWIN